MEIEYGRGGEKREKGRGVGRGVGRGGNCRKVSRRGGNREERQEGRKRGEILEVERGWREVVKGKEQDRGGGEGKRQD